MILQYSHGNNDDEDFVGDNDKEDLNTSVNNNDDGKLKLEIIFFKTKISRIEPL